LDNSYGLEYPIVQYADDTLIVLPADEIQLNSLKNSLHNFSLSTGLKVNYSKTSLIHINISAEICQTLANNLGCKAESLPFTYLGLPMGTTKPRIEHFINITERIDRRLSGIASLLSYDGRLLIVKTIFLSMLNYKTVHTSSSPVHT
jgi:hypothetical protein